MLSLGEANFFWSIKQKMGKEEEAASLRELIWIQRILNLKSVEAALFFEMQSQECEPFFKRETKQVGKGLLHNLGSFTHTVQSYVSYLSCCCNTVPLQRPTSAN